MSRIRDIANLFSANTDAATDAEVTAAISSHNTTANGHVKRGNTASRPASPSNGDVYANTETGYFEHYDGTSWTAVAVAASTPSSVVATNQGSGRSFNNGQASVAFTAGTIAGSTYTVTSSPGSYTATGSSSPLVVTGLQSSTQYTYTVTATNKWGTSSASSASSGVTATTVPAAPTINSVAAASQSAIITFTAGSTGGAAITSYSITSSPSTTTQTASSSPYTFTGLTDGTSYTFTMTATNSNGTSLSSSASSAVVPVSIIEDMVPLGMVQVGSTGSSEIEFTSIPSTYTHLQIRIMAKLTDTSNQGGYAGIRFNSDTSSSNYTFHRLKGDGSSASAYGSGSGTFDWIVNERIASSHSNFATEEHGVLIVDILDYKNTNKYTTVKTTGGYDSNGTGEIIFNSGLWLNTNIVSNIKVLPSAGNFARYTSVALYGIKG